MQLHLVVGATTLAALLAHATPAAAAPPSWCRGGSASNKPSYDLKSLFTETEVNAALINLVAASCYGESDVASLGKQLAATRAAWSKRLGLTEADWVEVNEWAHLSSSERGADTFGETDRKAAWSKLTPLDQFAVLSAARSSSVDNAYLADAFGAKLTQLGRLGYVQRCIERITQDDGPVALAMCATDIAALDAGKLAAEIAADKTHGTADRMTARIVAYDTLQKLATLKPQIAALRAKDPAYERMFELGVTAHKTWPTQAPAKAVQLAADLDDARVTESRKASQGCMPRALELWKDAVIALGAKRMAAIHAEPGNGFDVQLISMLIAEPAGYLAALTLTECATAEGNPDSLARAIGAALARWPGYRGPRTGTQTAILTAGLELDARGSTIEYPELSRDWITGDNNTTTVLAAVASVKTDGAKATITFAKQKVTQTRCTKGHSTSKVRAINADGSILYWYVCDKEITETIEVAPSPPLKVIARYAAELKPGMTAAVIDDIVAVAYAKGSTTPALVTGVVLK